MTIHFKIQRTDDYLIVLQRMFGRYYQLFHTDSFLNCLGGIADYCYLHNSYKTIILDPDGANPVMTIRYSKDPRIKLMLRRKLLFTGIHFYNISKKTQFLYMVKTFIHNIFINLNSTLMKKLFLLMAAVLLVACNNASDESLTETPAQKELVTISFSPYTMETITRGTATSISDFTKSLDVFLVEGTNVTTVHQAVTNASYGTVSLTLDKTKTYTLYAIAQNSTTNTVTFANNVFSFSNTNMANTFFYSTTFSPATTTSLSCTMTRVVGKFQITFADAGPAEATKLRFTITDAKTQLNTSGEGITPDDVILTFDKGSAIEAGNNCSFHLIANTDVANYTIKVEALTSADVVVQERTFTNVPIRNNYLTKYSGTFFTDQAMTMSFVADNTWNEFDAVNY